MGSPARRRSRHALNRLATDRVPRWGQRIKIKPGTIGPDRARFVSASRSSCAARRVSSHCTQRSAKSTRYGIALLVADLATLNGASRSGYQDQVVRGAGVRWGQSIKIKLCTRSRWVRVREGQSIKIKSCGAPDVLALHAAISEVEPAWDRLRRFRHDPNRPARCSRESIGPDRAPRDAPVVTEGSAHQDQAEAQSDPIAPRSSELRVGDIVSSRCRFVSRAMRS